MGHDMASYEKAMEREREREREKGHFVASIAPSACHEVVISQVGITSMIFNFAE